MERVLRSRMLFHGVIIILLGLLAGFGYLSAVSGNVQEEVRAWSMAHMEGLLNGVLVIAVSAAARVISLPSGQQKLLALAIIIAGYGNTLGAIVAATFGVRGLEPTGPAANLVAGALFGIAMIGVFVGLVLALVGAHRFSRSADS